MGNRNRWHSLEQYRWSDKLVQLEWSELKLELESREDEAFEHIEHCSDLVTN
jgi:hypothetical protein